MKKIILTLLSVFSLGVSAQSEKENYKSAAAKFKNFYKSAKYDSIFAMFDANMQKALPLDKTNIFFSQMKAGNGNIKSIEFLKLKNNVAHVYKTTFKNTLKDILIYLNPTNKISGLLITGHKPKDLPVIKRNVTKMILPFKEEWFVFWGGTSVKQNYHVAHENQKYAYDILMVKNGSSYKGDSKKNENYYVFGKEIIAPCDAKVAKVITGVKDNIPGELNPQQLTGNTIVLETINKEYILFAHLKEGSVIVKQGQLVKQGEVMAQCGNSGNTTEAHLHLSLQNHVEMDMSTGGKLYFDQIMVNGKIRNDYLPVKEDFVKNK